MQERGRALSSAVRFVHAHPRLNQRRRAIRFWQQVPLTDYSNVRRMVTVARARRFTLMAYAPLASLWNLAASLEVPGALVECGTCNGGSAAVIGAASPGRPLWLFDSWEGLPEPGRHDISEHGFTREPGWIRGSEDNVRHALQRVGADDRPVHLVKGWFEDTIAGAKPRIGPIAFLHLDCDWYDSVMLVLNELYDAVVPGGVIAVDDYQHWLGCRKAVHEFFGDVEALPRFERVGETIRFRKPAQSSISSRC